MIHVKRNLRFLAVAVALIILLFPRFDSVVNTLRYNIGALRVTRAMRETGADRAEREHLLRMAHAWLAPARADQCRFEGPALYSLGSAYFWLGDRTQAIQTLSTLVETNCFKTGDDRLVTAYARLGELYIQENEHGKAATNLELALANLAGGERGYFVSQVAVLLGKELETLGQTDKAAQHFIYAAELDRHNHAPFHRLMELYVQQKDYAAVLYWHERLKTLDPTDPWGPFFLGQMYLQQGAYQQAVASFRHAVELSPSSEQAHFWLGVTYAALEDWEHATQEIQSALEQNPGFSYYHTLLNEYNSRLRKERETPHRNLTTSSEAVR